MKPLLILKTGSRITSIPETWGDFEDWIIQGIAMPDDYFQVVSVFQNEALPSPDDVSGIIITGSPAMVTDELDWIRKSEVFAQEAVSSRIPVLGICFGHQLLAKALGGRVDWHPKGREIGTTEIIKTGSSVEDPLFGNLPGEFTAHVTHMQSVMTIPPEAQILAGNDFDPHHGLRFADMAWGVQFHPEFTASIMQQYIQARFEDIRQEGLDPERLLVQVQPAHDAMGILKKFADLCEV